MAGMSKGVSKAMRASAGAGPMAKAKKAVGEVAAGAGNSAAVKASRAGLKVNGRNFTGAGKRT